MAPDAMPPDAKEDEDIAIPPEIVVPPGWQETQFWKDFKKSYAPSSPQDVLAFDRSLLELTDVPRVSGWTLPLSRFGRETLDILFEQPESPYNTRGFRQEYLRQREERHRLGLSPEDVASPVPVGYQPTLVDYMEYVDHLDGCAGRRKRSELPPAACSVTAPCAVCMETADVCKVEFPAHCHLVPREYVLKLHITSLWAGVSWWMPSSDFRNVYQRVGAVV